MNLFFEENKNKTSTMNMALCRLAAVMLCMAAMGTRQVEGHGRLVDPPSRSSAWRYGFDTPRNYDDNQLFCGGFAVSQNYVISVLRHA